MRNIIFSSFFAVLIFIASTVTAQPPSSSPAATPAATFISLDGGFRVDLPARVSGFSGIKPEPGFSTGGSLFEWRLPDGKQYQIGFVDRIQLPAERASLLESLADALIAERSKSGYALVHRRNFKHRSHPGVEIRMTSDGGTAQTRYILVDNRLFILNTGWPLGKLSDSYVKPLDSFDLIDANEIIAKRLQDATPSDLPQSPRPSRAKSDAAIEHLNGKVKVVSVSKQYVEGGSTGGIVRSGDSFYDDAGYLVKTISFDYRGNPSHVTVFGFIDGKRVSKSGDYLDYEYNPPPAMAPPPPPRHVAGATPPAAVQEKTSDARYTSQYDFRFDSSKKVIERITLNNREEVISRVGYRFDGRTVEVIRYSKDGAVKGRSVSTFDDRENQVEETIFSTSPDYPENSNYNYKYVTFDEKGNWTKREVSATTARYKGGTNTIRYVEYRQISYY